jgi:hypothetical protein
MKRLFFHKLLIASLLFWGCNKLDIGEPTDGTPIFSATFNINNADRTWEAGVDSYYMYASFQKDSNDVFVFSGRLAKEGCSVNCGEELIIHIRDFQQISGSGSPQIELSLKPGNYGFFAPLTLDTAIIITYDTTRILHLDASASVVPNTAVSYLWSIGVTDQLAGQIVDYQLNPATPSAFPVTLNLTSAGGCTSSQQQTVRQDSSQFCSVHMAYDSLNSTLTAIPGGFPPFQFNWSTGDSLDFIGVNTLAGATYSVTITDANGCTSSASIGGDPAGGNDLCVAAFDYFFSNEIGADTTLIFNGDSLQFATVIIEYVNADGIRFRSDLADQDPASDAYFTIVAVEDFDDNEAGQKTKKLTIRFSCRLLGSNGSTLEIKEGKAVFAVAHP